MSLCWRPTWARAMNSNSWNRRGRRLQAVHNRSHVPTRLPCFSRTCDLRGRFGWACPGPGGAKRSAHRRAGIRGRGGGRRGLDAAGGCARLALPGRQFVLRYFGLQELWQAVADQQVDFVITHGGQYVALESRFGASRIARLKIPASHLWQGAGVGRGGAGGAAGHRESGRSRGKRLAAVAPDAFGGYLAALRELDEVGVGPGDLATIDFTGFPMQKAAGRSSPRARGCSGVAGLHARGTGGRRHHRRHRLSCAVVARGEWISCQLSSRLYPDWPFVSLHHTDRALAKEVATAFAGDGAAAGRRRVDRAGGLPGCACLYRELKMGPYACCATPPCWPGLKRLWWVFVGLFLIFAAGVVHAVRVEHQVAARTEALRKALAERDAAQARIQAQQQEAEHLSRLSILGELSSTLA